MTARRWLLALLGIGISALFLGLALSQFDLSDVGAALRRATLWPVLVASVWFFAAMWLITWRWQFLLNALKRVPVARLFPLVLIGYAGNNIYPFRSGEVVRLVLLRHKHSVPLVPAAATVLVERVFDGLVLLTFVLLPLPFTGVASPEVRQVAGVAAPVFVGALAVFLLMAARPNLLRATVAALTRPLPQGLRARLEGLAAAGLTGLAALRSPRNMAGTVLASYLTWGVQATVFHMVSWAFALDVSFALMLVVVGVVNLAGLIPASPGQIGVFEFFTSVVLVAAGIPEATAYAYALAVHVVVWLPVTLAGLALLAQQGLGLGALARADALQQQATEGRPA